MTGAPEPAATAPRPGAGDAAERYVGALRRRRWWVVALLVLAAAASGAGAHRLYFTTDYRVFFRADDPDLGAFESLRSTYEADDNVLFVLLPGDGRVFTRASLLALEDLTRRAWRLPHAIRVDSVTSFQASRAEGDELVVGDLVPDASALDEAALARIERVALAEPMIAGRLVSRAGDAAGVNVTFALPREGRHLVTPRVAAAARALGAAIRADHHLADLQVTGMLMLDSALTEVPVADLRVLVPLMFTVVCAALWLALRCLAQTLVTLAVTVLSIAAATGAAGWLGIHLTPPSAAAPIIILTLAVADCVHLLATFRRARADGLGTEAAIARSLRVNLRPITVTSATTAAGFLGLNFSASPPFQDLGNVVAIGVGVAWGLAVTLLPALLAQRAAPAGRGAGAGVPGAGAMRALADLAVRRRRALLWGGAALGAVLVLGIPRNQLDDQFVEYFRADVPFRHATDVASERLTGLYALHFSLRSPRTGAVADPAFLRAVDRFAAWLRAQPEVSHVQALPDLLRRLNRNLHGDDPAWHRLPERREQAAQALLLYELSLPYGRTLRDLVDATRTATRVTASLAPLSSRALLDFERRALDRLAADAPGVEVLSGGSPLMFARIGMRNIRTMLAGTALALVAISLLLVAALGSVRLGLLSLVPNLMPAAMAFGLWGLLVGEVGMALSVVASMTLGIVVDDTVHFLSKYRQARAAGETPEAAVRHAFATVGPAMWTTSAVLGLGFLVLFGSAFVPNASMGLLTVITIACALLADFLFLPALLLSLERDPAGATRTWPATPG